MQNGIELAILTANEDLQWLYRCPICAGHGNLAEMAEDGYYFDISDYDLQDVIHSLREKYGEWLIERCSEDYGGDMFPDEGERHEEWVQEWLSELSWDDFDFDNVDALPFLLDALYQLGAIEKDDFDEVGNCQHCDDEGNNDALYWSYVWPIYNISEDDLYEKAKEARRLGCYLFGDGDNNYLVFQGCGFDASWVLCYAAYKLTGYLDETFIPDGTGGSVFISEEARKELSAAIVEHLDSKAQQLWRRNDFARLAGVPEVLERIDILKTTDIDLMISNFHTVLKVLEKNKEGKEKDAT